MHRITSRGGNVWRMILIPSDQFSTSLGCQCLWNSNFNMLELLTNENVRVFALWYIVHGLCDSSCISLAKSADVLIVPVETWYRSNERG